jgi:predicted nuclease with TOPRIM domain
MDSKEYKEYLKSEVWSIRRQVCLERFGGQCAMCENKAWHAHHRTYDRVGHENVYDLTALCGECHEKFHGKGKYEDVEVELMLEAKQRQEEADSQLRYFNAEFNRITSETLKLKEQRKPVLVLSKDGRARLEEIDAALERLNEEGRELHGRYKKAQHAARQP